MRSKMKITLGVVVLVTIIGVFFPQLIHKDSPIASENINRAQEVFNNNGTSLEEPETVTEKTIIKGIILVNKTYGLPSNYNPGENPEAVEALYKMTKAAQEEIGKTIQSVSGFRSYEYQKNLFNQYAQKDGVEKASTYSARAGHSEHQTGLAFDIGGRNKEHWVKTSFERTEEGKWLKDNAHKYGFILRYPKGKTHITGYTYEPWHFRYVGVEHAEIIYKNDLTLEEYLLEGN
ncbi:M15 family metallopeptidase [Irregularibacter muris]|uniref:M15 family metallopeptidase n=1 Tax=Irregularibacter muris TaxID=1796619 RepID=A0AAE3HFH0_9FIRM|nr:M15 family metallopeptidase [Irregularibacter muris]MCR1899607.1 M15 family metallopeptidase [Irregularibacter muris]